MLGSNLSPHPAPACDVLPPPHRLRGPGDVDAGSAALGKWHKHSWLSFLPVSNWDGASKTFTIWTTVLTIPQLSAPVCGLRAGIWYF